MSPLIFKYESTYFQNMSPLILNISQTVLNISSIVLNISPLFLKYKINCLKLKVKKCRKKYTLKSSTKLSLRYSVTVWSAVWEFKETLFLNRKDRKNLHFKIIILAFNTIPY